LSNKLKNEMKEKNERTTISISKGNHARLKSFGSMHMSMNEVIEKILAHQVGAYKTKMEDDNR